MGVPMLLCLDVGCLTVHGFWSWIMEVVPFNGWFWLYENSYPVALYDWLMAPVRET